MIIYCDELTQNDKVEILLNLLYSKNEPTLTTEEILNSINELITDIEFDITLHANIMREMKNLKTISIESSHQTDTIYKIENTQYIKYYNNMI